MTADPDTVAPDVEVADALTSLAEHGYRHIPVVDDGKLVGIVSMRDLMRIGPDPPGRAPGRCMDVPKGLEGVVVAETEVGDVRGQEGFYHYRQYNAVELAEKRTLEDVWHLLFEGHLPDQGASATRSSTRSGRCAADPRQRSRGCCPAIADGRRALHPARRAAHRGVAGRLRRATSSPASTSTATTLRANAMQISAVIPTLIMALYRLNQGHEPIDPHPDLAVRGQLPLHAHRRGPRRPSHARAIEQYLISTIDHGFNASTFTARVITSTGADLGSAVVGAIGALSGPLHGGAPSRALDMLDAIGTPDNAEAVDPRRGRAGRAGSWASATASTRPTTPARSCCAAWPSASAATTVEFAKQVEKTVVDVLAELKPGRKLYANVEFYAGVVMDQCGLPRDLFTPTFASSRVIGWCANILEQAADNRIIRPSARYVGPPPPEPVPELE